ncbi:MAG: serine O-acetyltransferase [Acetobacteraceae bacterium]|nr:serine O-acetyltransferase [Acetobacteraceae bacterium]MBV8524879.1 serine O-acetyltransferase [Acetobacteraceae bacterium]
MAQPHLVLCNPDREESPLVAQVWSAIRQNAQELQQSERALARQVEEGVLRRDCFAEALGFWLARKLRTPELDVGALLDLIGAAFDADPSIVAQSAFDLQAIKDRDPACPNLLTPVLFFKGYQALQAYRISHRLWNEGRVHLARHLQSRISEVFAIDIHPAARIGKGVLVDHGTGLVIGETSVVEDDVSLLQGVTLGGTGKECGDRHPKIRRGVLIGAGAKVLGNIEVGEGAKIGAGSVVVSPVPPYTTVVGIPARPVGPPNTGMPALTMDQSIWTPDYVI